MPEWKIESMPEVANQQESPVEQALPEGWKIESLPEETTAQQLGRVGAGVAKGVTQRAFGAALGGDIASGIGSLADVGLQKLVGEESGQKVEELMKLYEENQPEGLLGLAPKELPTSKKAGEFIKEKAESFFGIDPQFWKPKGKIEKIVQSSAKDFTSLVPALLFSPVTLPAIAAEAVIPNLVKMGAKSLGASKGTQRLSKLGSQLMIGAFNLYKPRKESKLAYDIAEQSLPKGTRVPTESTAKTIKNIQNRFYRSRLEPKYKKIVQEHIDSLRDISPIKTSNLRQLIAQKNDLSTIMREPGTPKKALGLLGDIRKSLLKDINAYGVHNKEFGKAFKYAEKLQKDIHQDAKAFTYINDFLNKKNIGIGGVASLVLGALTGNPLGYLKYLAGGLGLKGGIHVLNKLAKSPAMYKYYGKIISTAASRRPQQLAKLITKFNEEISNEFPEQNALPQQ